MNVRDGGDAKGVCGGAGVCMHERKLALASYK